MTRGAFTYAEFDRALTDAIPEMRAQVENTLEQVKAGGSPQPYAVVVLALKPFLRKLLDQRTDAGLLQRIFDFLEEMACSPDIEVVNLLQVGIFQSLVGEPDRLAAAWKYMGEETKTIARATARTYRCEHNLPERKGTVFHRIFRKIAQRRGE